ncbi:MAG TPA: hypothetical protein VIR79_07780 [Nitrospira sp.]
MMREWIIFALCLGVGGHVALGVMLHAPDLWPWNIAGFYGLLSGIAVYAIVQAGRGLWKLLKPSSQAGTPRSSDSQW